MKEIRKGAVEAHGSGKFYWRCVVHKEKLLGRGDILFDFQEYVGWSRVGKRGGERRKQHGRLEALSTYRLLR